MFLITAGESESLCVGAKWRLEPEVLNNQYLRVERLAKLRAPEQGLDAHRAGVHVSGSDLIPFRVERNRRMNWDRIEF